jgi:dolichol-phosphate mannosyltransferase
MELSVIIPIFEEEHTVEPLVERLVATLEAYPGVSQWEIIAVDDASGDATPRILARLQERFPRLRVERHATRQGQKGCFMTGFTLARGRLAVLMDADLQVLPEEVPLLLDKALGEGYQMVCTYNDPRRGGKPRNLVSRLGNLFMKLLFRSPVQDAGANFMAVEVRFLKGVRLVENDQRYLLPIAMRRGLERIGEVGCRFMPRRFGRSKYSYLQKTLEGLPEMLRLKRRLRAGFYDRPPVEE